MLVSIVGAAPYAYITNYSDNEVAVIDTATKLVAATVSGLHGPWGIAVTPNGKNVYVTNLASNNVSVINTKSNTVTAQVPVGNWPYGVAVTPDGKKVYVTNQYDAMGNISVINTTNNAVTNVLTNIFGVDSMLFGIAVTPNGKQVYAANYGGINTSVINPSTNTVATTVPVGNNSVAFGQFIG